MLFVSRLSTLQGAWAPIFKSTHVQESQWCLYHGCQHNQVSTNFHVNLVFNDAYKVHAWAPTVKCTSVHARITIMPYAAGELLQLLPANEIRAVCYSIKDTSSMLLNFSCHRWKYQSVENLLLTKLIINSSTNFEEITEDKNAVKVCCSCCHDCMCDCGCCQPIPTATTRWLQN